MIATENCRNIDQYNRKVSPAQRLPRVVIFFDEVANWMQDDEFKQDVDSEINKIATKSRAAGFHLFLVYQRADNQVMTMQLRTNLGNKLILRLGDEGSSRIALNEKGAERLLGKGHVIAKLDTDDKIYLQVPFIGDDEVEQLAEAIIESWSTQRQHAAE
jgi:S-DNA-T family DNA segregation ATPase FtsK/SpoIIIE